MKYVNGNGIPKVTSSCPNLRRIVNFRKLTIYGKKEKITVEIAATNVVASRPPNGEVRLQRRPLVPIYSWP